MLVYQDENNAVTLGTSFPCDMHTGASVAQSALVTRAAVIRRADRRSRLQIRGRLTSALHLGQRIRTYLLPVSSQVAAGPGET